MVSNDIEARRVDEFWTIVGYRDYWAGELSSLNARAAMLEDRPAALRNAIDGMRVQEGILGEILSGVSRIPSACGLWQGARAKESFSQCTEGGLYGIYKGALDAAGETIRELEAAMRDLNSRLDQVNANRMEADRNYAFWDQKVVCYW